MWNSSDLYQFMCVHAYAFGYDIKSKYKGYTSEQLAPIFTRRFLKLLDLSALVALPFIDFEYIQTLIHSLCERRDICDITDTSPACDSEYRALVSLLDQLCSSYLFYVQDPSAKDTLPF